MTEAATRHRRTCWVRDIPPARLRSFRRLAQTLLGSQIADWVKVVDVDVTWDFQRYACRLECEFEIPTLPDRGHFLERLRGEPTMIEKLDSHVDEVVTFLSMTAHELGMGKP